MGRWEDIKREREARMTAEEREAAAEGFERARAGAERQERIEAAKAYGKILFNRLSGEIKRVALLTPRHDADQLVSLLPLLESFCAERDALAEALTAQLPWACEVMEAHAGIVSLPDVVGVGDEFWELHRRAHEALRTAGLE